jgi:hypothetical protein
MTSYPLTPALAVHPTFTALPGASVAGALTTFFDGLMDDPTGYLVLTQ